ncbi:MAG: hypothetical protein IT454_12060 [Planctomycetes bacterium]|nr:hypothetical protein [Planctomycetota bacterium]
MNFSEPFPLDRDSIERALNAMEAGIPYREAYEQLLLEVDDATADRTMQLQRESRGAWLLLLRGPCTSGARALFIGNALSGAHVPLAHHGYELTLLDRNALRLRFATLRNAALVPGQQTRTVCGDGAARLPFADREFELVVAEDGLPDPARGWGHDLEELRRICGGELLLVADNRFAYKRSTGRRGVFDVPSPGRYASSILTRRSERSLAGYRALAQAPGFERPRSFALYPDAREFTFVVGLDGPELRLELGPKERRNRWKILAQRFGLFPWLAPSFALASSRTEWRETPTRVERILSGLARTLGEPVPRVEHLVATRGNSAVLLTRGESSEAAAGSWCVHVGLSAAQRNQMQTHMQFLRRLANSAERCPVPEPLVEAFFDGVYVTCERRIAGWTAPQLTGELQATARTLSDLSRILSGLVVERDVRLDEALFEELLGSRFDLVRRHARVPSTEHTLDELRRTTRRRVLGRRLPLVIQHADLRSKHVQVRPDGSVLAILDWGSARPRDLPYYDLFHYLAHERKQAQGLTPRQMWMQARSQAQRRPDEQTAIDDYCAAVGLDGEMREVLEELYPVLVSAMVEAHWDFSRPRWLQRQFEL